MKEGFCLLGSVIVARGHKDIVVKVLWVLWVQMPLIHQMEQPQECHVGLWFVTAVGLHLSLSLQLS